MVRLLREGGRIIALVKPQFEAGRGRVGKGGVVRDPEVHRGVLEDLAAWAEAGACGIQQIATSPIKGPAGQCRVSGTRWRPGAPNAMGLESRIDEVLLEAAALQPGTR